MKSPESIQVKALNRIYGWGRGKVFTPSHFLDLGSRVAVDHSLSRLEKKGTIRRLAFGLYDYPKRHPRLGDLLPSNDAVAQAIAESAKVKLQPSGAYAANLLGLSEQVPMRITYLTSGTSRKVRLGKREIILKKTTPREMITAGRISGLVIQALRYLGQNEVTPELLEKLRSRLTEEEKEQIRKDTAYAPAWIGRHMKKILEK